MKIIQLLAILALFSVQSCSNGNASDQPEVMASNTEDSTKNDVKQLFPFFTPLNCDYQVGNYVRAIFEDSRGLVWFGTGERGVAASNGIGLYYHTDFNGMGSNQVNNMAEDSNGLMWFATTGGVTTFDGAKYHTYTTEDGLPSNDVWSLFIDSKGTIWAGATNGLSVFLDGHFVNLELPIPDDIKEPTYIINSSCVRDMAEDLEGNMWFARDGYGLTKFDGKNFTMYTKKDGLTSNAVSTVMADKQGNIWAATVETRIPEEGKPFSFVASGDGGLNLFDGATFKHFAEISGLWKNDVYPIYQDSKGIIWVGAKEHGVYRIEGDSISNFSETSGITRNNPQSILEDQHGNLFIGFSGGLFQLSNGKLENIKSTDFRDGC